MAQYRVKTKQYCSLSKNQKWQSWLQSVSQELYDDLMNHHLANHGCKSNHIKMMEIQRKLNAKKLLPSMVQFLLKEFPNTVEEVKTPTVKPKVKPIKISNDDKGVFGYYNPKLLTFPQKIIIENDNKEELERQVHDFCKDKIDTDYLIIGNKAYIEYFRLKYSKESKKISLVDRDIHQYRLKNNINPLAKSV
jgi:hypothetical protein